MVRRLGLAALPAAGAEPVVVGVSGPLTGQHAQYGAQWQKGFDLALEEVNSQGGIAGRSLQIQFEDSQSDPKQSVAIARKFTADPRIVVDWAIFPVRPPWRPRRSTSRPGWSNSASPIPTPISPGAAISCGATPPTRPTRCRCWPTTPSARWG